MTPYVLDTTRQMLERLGALVRTAHNSEAGMRAAAIHRPHLILIDVDMPDMDGFELARRLRKDAQLGRTRLVALTSLSDLPAAMRGWSIEFDGHINKPVTEQSLPPWLGMFPVAGRPPRTGNERRHVGRLAPSHRSRDFGPLLSD